MRRTYDMTQDLALCPPPMSLCHLHRRWYGREGGGGWEWCLMTRTDASQSMSRGTDNSNSRAVSLRNAFKNPRMHLPRARGCVRLSSTVFAISLTWSTPLLGRQLLPKDALRVTRSHEKSPLHSIVRAWQQDPREYRERASLCKYYSRRLEIWQVMGHCVCLLGQRSRCLFILARDAKRASRLAVIDGTQIIPAGKKYGA